MAQELTGCEHGAYIPDCYVRRVADLEAKLAEQVKKNEAAADAYHVGYRAGQATLLQERDDLKARLAEAEAEIETARALIGVSREIERSDHAELERQLSRLSSDIGGLLAERDALQARLEQAREALLDSNSMLRCVRDENDEGAIAEQILDNLKVLAALNAGKAEIDLQDGRCLEP